MNTYSTTTRNSYGSRLGKALKGLIIGPLFIFGAIALLWWNEGRAVDRIRDLNSGEKSVVTLTSPTFTSENDGQLIYTTGVLSSGNITDTDFGVQVTGTLLDRKVEMYQWKEIEKETRQDNLGGSEAVTKTYTYEKVWSETLLNSQTFNQAQLYKNPAVMEHSSQEFLYNPLTVGDFNLGSELSSFLRASTELLSTNLSSQKEGYNLSGNFLYKGKEISNPNIGDIRVSYSYLPAETQVSILGKQNSDKSITAYSAKNSQIAKLVLGIQSAESMFELLHQENTILTWILRGVGFFLMYTGWSLFFSIIPILAAVVPLFKHILGFGVGIIAVILSVVISGTVIIIAWIFVRPLVALLVFLLVVGLVYAVLKYRKRDVSVAVPTTV